MRVQCDRVRVARWVWLGWLGALAACSGSRPDATGTTSTASAAPASASSPISATTTSAGASHRVDIGGLQFDLPAELGYRIDGFTSTADSVFAFYGNVPLTDECHTPGGACGRPLDVLPPGGILVSWGNASFLDPSPSGGAATNTSIAGFPSTVTTERPGQCSDLGGDETITARIYQPNRSDFLMRACLRGPDLSRSGEQLVVSMLASVTVGPPAP